ncbi:MAG: hypothetical protein NVV66_18420 [Cellulomonas sp.]|uniref:hypothetical protein n=1 Tax=Cellulomonas sp. TaxID=40001 RepID=UPI002583100E|nr:hypothetical protein [Cellulomonas sp.]MCR6706573.1 hypothetical protein [Cellulomonas sp.]
MRWIQDHPFVVTTVVLAAVVAHAVAAAFWSPLDIWHPLVEMEPDGVGVLYLGLAGLSAAIAGFAGVIVIFGLEGHSRKFLTFRVAAGNSLRANWMSVVLSSFASAAIALVATVLAFLGRGTIGPWLFELSAFLIFHSAARLTWLLSALMRVVASEDEAQARENNKRSLDSLFAQRKVS